MLWVTKLNIKGQINLSLDPELAKTLAKPFMKGELWLRQSGVDKFLCLSARHSGSQRGSLPCLPKD